MVNRDGADGPGDHVVEYVRTEGYLVGRLDGKGGRDPTDVWTKASDVPTPELLRGWRNRCDAIVMALAGTSNAPDDVLLPHHLWTLSLGSVAVMRRSSAATPNLAKLRAAINDVQTTTPALQVPALFGAWRQVAPEILARLRDPIARAREEVDEIEVRGAAPPIAAAPTGDAKVRAKKGDEPKRCIVEEVASGVARVTEGETVVEVRGQRQVDVLLAVYRGAGQDVRWKDLVKADMGRANAEMMDRRTTASGTSRKAAEAANVNPRFAMNPESMQSTGSRVRRALGKLGYHWKQDGNGARWDQQCQ